MLPDFFVLGAQKAATTTLCAILSAHPRLFFSEPREPFFFDADDYACHPESVIEGRREWWCDWDANRPAGLAAYEALFAGAPPDALKGDGSTTYLPSRRAPGRIAALCPDAKLIVMLRDPVQRAYSGYWHQVRRQRATLPFESQLKVGVANILEMGFYKEQIERYLALFPRERMHFILVEQFRKDPRKGVGEVLAFLGLEDTLDDEALARREHPALVPRFTDLQLLINAAGHRWGRPQGWHELVRHERQGIARFGDRVLDKLSGMNMKVRPYPPMASATRARLVQIYRAENKGLSDLIGLDVDHAWGWERDPAA